MNMSLFGGRAEYKALCDSPEALVDELRKSIAVRNIKVTEGCLEFCCFYTSRKDAERICSEHPATLVTKKYSGPMYVISKYRKRAGLFFGFVFMALSVFLSSFFVWDISVEGNERVRDDEIIYILESLGFKEGVLKRNVDIDNIVNMLLVGDDRISWAAINFDGTVAHVEIKEARIVRMSEKRKNVNLVASHNGIVVRVDALRGQAKVTSGETVTKGQLLVSAFVDKRTGGNLLTGAYGYVFALTERGYCVCVPLEYSCKSYTGRQNKKYTLSMLGRDLSFYLGFEKELGVCERNVKKGKITLYDKIHLPLTVKTHTFSEYAAYTKRRTQGTALEIARQTAKERLKRDSGGFVMSDCEEEYEISDGVLVYKCTFSGVENIASALEFDIDGILKTNM